MRSKRVKPELPPSSPTAPAADTTEPLHLHFAELQESHCRWPYGDGPFTFCGHSRAGDSSYCGHHERIAWHAAGPKRKGGFRVSVVRKRPLRKAA